MRYLLEQEFLRSARQITRYPTDNIIGFVVGCVFFLLLFNGLKLAGAAGSALVETNLSVVVLSYFFWLLITSCISGVSGDLHRDMSTGAIDLLMESRHGLALATAVRAIASLVVSAVMSALLLSAGVLITGQMPVIGTDLLMPAIAIVLQGLALGLLAGALVLCLKRIKVLLTLITFALLPVFLLPVRADAERVYDWLFPVVVLKRRIAGETWRLDVDFAIVGAALVQLCIAYWILRACVHVAMRNGSARNV